MSRNITLAFAQINPKLGDLEANLDCILRYADDAAQQGAQWVLFPELALTGYNQELLQDNLMKLALSTDDDPIQQLTQKAAQLGIYLVVGFIEKRQIPGILYNSIIICGPNGSVLTTYAKSHLFSSEKLHFRPGSTIKVLRTPIGAIGFMICMDISYPEVARVLSLQGAELLIAPSAWIKEDEDLWPLHLRARASDNLVFVAGMNRIGVEGNLHFIGQSMLIDPRGHVLAELGGEEDILLASVDLDKVLLARRRALYWTGRRPELYSSVADIEAN